MAEKQQQVLSRPTSPHTAFIGLGEVAALCHVQAQTIRVWIKAGNFPAGFTVPGGRKLLWRAADVERFLLDRLAAASEPDAQTEVS
jgi:hypothetical protein